MNVHEFIGEFNRVDGLRTKPYDLRLLPDDYTVDENKSVRWNREEVKRRNETYKNKVAELKEEKRKQERIVLAKVYKKNLRRVRY